MTAEARTSVSRQEIVEAALALIGEDGYERLSMRRLAKRLDVFPATIYWHAGNKSHLLGLVCECVLSTIDLPDDELEWDEWLFIFGLETRGVIGAHPRFATYFVGNIQSTQASLNIAERVLSAFVRGGFSGDNLHRAYNAYMGSLFGWISGEFATAAQGEGEAERAFYEREVTGEGAAYPVVKRNWPLLRNRTFMLRWDSGAVSPLGSSFEFMLRSLLEGMSSARLVNNDSPT